MNIPIITMEEQVSILVDAYVKEKMTSKELADKLYDYNSLYNLPLHITMFIGSEQVIFGFEVCTSGSKMIFMSKIGDKQFMFTYDKSTEKFIGKSKIGDLSGIGLTLKNK